MSHCANSTWSDLTLLAAVGVWTFRRGAGGDGSSGCSLPVYGHPDPAHLAAAAATAATQWGHAVGSERRPAKSAGLPLSLPLQTGHQPQDHPRVSHMNVSSSCCHCEETSLVFIERATSDRWQQRFGFVRNVQAPTVFPSFGIEISSISSVVSTQ